MIGVLFLYFNTGVVGIIPKLIGGAFVIGVFINWGCGLDMEEALERFAIVIKGLFNTNGKNYSCL